MIRKSIVEILDIYITNNGQFIEVLIVNFLLNTNYLFYP